MALLKRRRAGLGDAMDVVTKFVNACNRHDADGVYACLHPDFDSIQPMYPSRNFRGADQVRRNWQAIFDAEPGFRLTVLRSAAMDDTVWLELHGAGEDAEVAGIFVMGIVGDRIRWARIYSALVEPVPPGMGEPAAQSPGLRQVSPVGDGPPAPTDSGDLVVEEPLIAPVLDMERSTRRRRRRRAEERDAGAPAEEEPDGPEGVTRTDVRDNAGTVPAVEAEPEPEAEAETEPEAEAEPEAVVGSEPEPEPDVSATATVDVVRPEPDAGAEPAVEVIADEPVAATEAVVVVDPAADDKSADEPEVDAGPDTEAIPLIVWDDDPAEEGEPVSEAEPGILDRPHIEPDDPGPRRRLFGKGPRS